MSREGMTSLLGSGSGAPPSQPARMEALLSREDFEETRERALRGCSLPPSVVDILSDLREHLVREKEPPVFVSDRRMLKAADLLRVAAYADGRARVAELDCLLLADLLWHAPEDRPEIATWLLERVCRREEDARARFLLRGVVRRACVAERAEKGDPDLAQDVQSLVRIAEERLAGGRSETWAVVDLMFDPAPIPLPVPLVLPDVMRLQQEGATLLQDHLWISRDDAQRAATALAPRVASGLEEARRYLKDVVTLQVCGVRKSAGVRLQCENGYLSMMTIRRALHLLSPGARRVWSFDGGNQLDGARALERFHPKRRRGRRQVPGHSASTSQGRRANRARVNRARVTCASAPWLASLLS